MLSKLWQGALNAFNDWQALANRVVGRIYRQQGN